MSVSTVYEARYASRNDNSSVMAQKDYSTYTGGLYLKDASAFRKSIATVLRAEGFKKESGTRFTATDKGFNLETAYLGKDKMECKFDYPADSVATKNAFFMQAIAQFLVMMFIQLIVDLEGVLASNGTPETKLATAKRIKKACSDAVEMARLMVLKPNDPTRAKTSSIDPESRFPLLQNIAQALHKVTNSKQRTGVVVTVTANKDPLTLVITMKEKEKDIVSTIDFKDVKTNDIFIIFNANIAATLLLAAKDKHLGAIQLKNLRPVLDGFMKAIDAVSSPSTWFSKALGKVKKLGEGDIRAIISF